MRLQSRRRRERAQRGHAGWAPIMGVGYYQNISHWSKGEYAYANNTEDDTAIISSVVRVRQ